MVRVHHAPTIHIQGDSAYVVKKKGRGLLPSPSLPLGSAFLDPFIEPVVYLLLQPPYPGGAELYPFRELPGRFESSDVSW